MVFAAIDIGSNAIRLLFSRVFIVDGKPHFTKEELIRMPIRLGEDGHTDDKPKGLLNDQQSDAGTGTTRPQSLPEVAACFRFRPV